MIKTSIAISPVFPEFSGQVRYIGLSESGLFVRRVLCISPGTVVYVEVLEETLSTRRRNEKLHSIHEIPIVYGRESLNQRARHNQPCIPEDDLPIVRVYRWCSWDIPRKGTGYPMQVKFLDPSSLNIGD